MWVSDLDLWIAEASYITLPHHNLDNHHHHQTEKKNFSTGWGNCKKMWCDANVVWW